MKRLLITAATIFLCLPALASEGLGPSNSLHKTFNAAAKKLDINVRMVLGGCSGPDETTCMYSMTGNLAAVSGALFNDRKEADNLTILLGNDADTTVFVVSMGIAMAAWSPKSDKEERGLAIKTLSKAIPEKTHKKVDLDGTSYALGFSEKVKAITFVITRP